MFRINTLVLIVFLASCKEESQDKSQLNDDTSKKIMTYSVNDEFKLTARFTSFDTTVEVLFTDTKDSINETQKKNYEGFIAIQDSLTPDILQKVFEYYKKSYPDIKKIWTKVGVSKKELEKHVPLPTTPGNLKPFITPAIIHIQNKYDCEEGTFAIEFDCTWDAENGLGVLIKNWKVKEASVAEIAYF